MQAEARTLLDELLRPENALQISFRHWLQILHGLRNHHLFSLWPRCLHAMLYRQDALLSKAQNASARAAASIPSLAVAILLDCASKSEVAPDASLLLPGQPADLRGPALAAWLLSYLRSPEMTERFQRNTDPFEEAAVLQAHVDAVQIGSTSATEQLAAARRFYDAITSKNDVLHAMMLSAYGKAGDKVQQKALLGHILSDTSAQIGVGVISVKLNSIHSELAERQRAIQSQLSREEPGTLVTLPAEVLNLWEQACRRPAQCINAVVVSSMLKLHALVGDVSAMFAVARQALQLEQRSILPSPSTPALQPRPFAQYLSNTCYTQLFDAAARCHQPEEWSSQVEQLYEFLLRRHTAAIEEPRTTKRKLEQQLDDAVHGTYFKYLQRSWQHEKLAERWRALPDGVKQGNMRIYLAVLNAVAPSGNTIRAAEIVEQEMPRMGVPLTLPILNAWMNCAQRYGRWREAERIWLRMGELRLVPSSSTYTELLLVYTVAGVQLGKSGDGEEAQPIQSRQHDKIDSVLEQLLGGYGGGAEVAANGLATPVHPPLQLGIHDLQRLIKTSSSVKQHHHVRLWAAHAKEIGVSEKLDQHSYHICQVAARKQQ